MAKPPAYIFVVRHGMRLDVADKTWAESSPMPYDTPLCYSGWIQARAVGARIASILAQAEAESDAPQSPTLSPSISSTTSAQKPRRRRFKVAIHSSPFLRCVQTSIGISAGLAQPITTGPPTMPTTRRGSPNHVVIPSPILKPIGSGSTRPNLDNLDSLESLDSQHHHHFHKAILRLDEFLGEWLSAGYYETIEPPPKSSTMIANAKAQLLKREIYAKNFNQSMTSPVAASHLAPLLWTGGRAAANTVAVPEDPFEGQDSDPETEDLPPPRPLGELGYIAPVPHYAISSSDKIPDSYVAHARDSCIVFDYQWESSGPDLDWGDGATFPEEWTSMHNRFRKGLQGLVDWYSTTEDAADIAHIRGAAEKDKIEDTWSEDGDDDVDIESVVIMVSHGAGCNALIGAMTHQPALMDVSMASLTMAVRKTGSEYEHMSPWLPNSDQTDDTSLHTVKNSIPVHQYYDMRLIASTEHLRTASSSAGLVRSGVIPSWSFGINKPAVSRGRVSTMTSSFAPPPVVAPKILSRPENSMWSHNRSSSMSASFGLPEIGLFSPRKEDDADYRFSSANQGDVTSCGSDNISGGITIGSGVTSFMKKRDDGCMTKNMEPAPTPAAKLSSANIKVLSTKSSSNATSTGRLSSPLSTSSSYSGGVLPSNNRTATATTASTSMASSISSLPPLALSSNKGSSGLWGITNRKTSGSSVLMEDDDEDNFFPDFENKRKFTPPISQNTSRRASPTLALKSTLSSMHSPLASPTLVPLSSGCPMETKPALSATTNALPSFEISLTSFSETATTNMNSTSTLASRASRLGNSPVRSPIHSPMGSPIREPLISPFFGDTSGNVEPVIRSRISTSRMWGAPGS
ncbi:Histidine phosphatase superfamily (branch 1) [Ceratocystis lukuohia]|uniref:Histidine phosphatase superfamily (Branch 1) n=1 Tax=Ceratocystis lukuohia TaxID=2019550 RepID=A0ABR4MPS0_9PEZI